MSKENINGKTKNEEEQNVVSKKIIIAGGGTGGHIFPALAIAEALKKKMLSVDILFIGAKGKMEMEKIPEAGYKITGLDIAGYNRSSLIKNFSLPVKLVKSFFQVRKILSKFRPDAVIGVGGYSSFPVLRVAQMKGIPTFIHESNSLPGRSNIMLGKRATKIFVPSEGMKKYFPEKKIIVTGNPVRKIFLEKISRKDALNFFGLEENIPTVFAMGGSLGAKSINEVIDKNIEVFKKNKLQLIWQTGKLFAPQAAKAEEEKNNIWTNAFVTRIDYAYAAADVVVARAGAMTIAELAVMGKATIFVPYPFASEDHQTANALTLINKNAALMVKDTDAATDLIQAIIELVNNKEEIIKLENNILKTGIANADELIADEILKVMSSK